MEEGNIMYIWILTWGNHKDKDYGVFLRSYKNNDPVYAYSHLWYTPGRMGKKWRKG